jgi:hypothetical protein
MSIRRALAGVGFVIAALLGTVCAAIIIAVVVQLVRGDETGPIGKDFIGIPLIVLLAFLLMKAARDLWRGLRVGV